MGAIVGWLKAHGTDDSLAGCGFLIGADVFLTCAHVIRDHHGLSDPMPEGCPNAPVIIRFEALQEEVSGRVLAGGWFTNARKPPGTPADIAVVRLDAPVSAIAPLPAIAQRMPGQSRPVLIRGAEADYKSYGQQVPATMGGSNIPRGWRQLDPARDGRGFQVRTGFSGAPVLDDLGNIVMGMVVAVAEEATGVAYAIPTETLWAALTSAQVTVGIRSPDATDRLADKAMARLRADFEARLAEREARTQDLEQELDLLRQGVRTLEQDARANQGDDAGPALAAATTGDVQPAAEVLRRILGQRLRAANTARDEAAAVARQLGAILKPMDAVGALLAFRQATSCDPDDAWTWIEVGRLELQAGTLDGASAAIGRALELSGSDDAVRAAALDDQGDLRVAQGALAGADASYRAGLAIAERLASSDPGNAGWQRDLSVSHNKIGDVQVAQGALAGAEASYRAGLAILERLASSDPGNAGWQRDLAINYGRVGDIELRCGSRTDGNLLLDRGRRIIVALIAQTPESAILPQDLAWFDALLNNPGVKP